MEINTNEKCICWKQGSYFPHKKGRVGKIGSCLKKKGRGGRGGTLLLIFMLTNPFQSYLSRSEQWCVFYVFTLYLSILFQFIGKN